MSRRLWRSWIEGMEVISILTCVILLNNFPFETYCLHPPLVLIVTSASRSRDDSVRAARELPSASAPYCPHISKHPAANERPKPSMLYAVLLWYVWNSRSVFHQHSAYCIIVDENESGRTKGSAGSCTQSRQVLVIRAEELKFSSKVVYWQ